MSVNPFKPFDPYIASKLAFGDFAYNLLTSVDQDPAVAEKIQKAIESASDMQAKLIVLDTEYLTSLSDDKLFLDFLVSSNENNDTIVAKFHEKFSHIPLSSEAVESVRKAFKNRQKSLGDFVRNPESLVNLPVKIENNEEKLAAARRLVDERKGLPNNIAVPAFGGLFTQALSTQFSEKPGMAKELSAAVAYLQISMRMDLLAQYGDLDYVEAKIFPNDPPELQSLSKTFNELIALRRVNKARLTAERREFYATEGYNGFVKGVDILNKDFPDAAKYIASEAMWSKECLFTKKKGSPDLDMENDASKKNTHRSFLDAAGEIAVRNPFITQFVAGLGIGFIARAGFTLAAGAVAMPLAPLAVVVIGGALAGGAVGVFREDFRAYKAKKENAANGNAEENTEQKIEKVRFIDKTILGVKIQTDFMVNPRVKAAFWGAITGGLTAGLVNVGLNYVMENYMTPQAAAPQGSSSAASDQASGNKISAANVSENNASATNNTLPKSDAGSQILEGKAAPQPEGLTGSGSVVEEATKAASQTPVVHPPLIINGQEVSVEKFLANKDGVYDHVSPHNIAFKAAVESYGLDPNKIGVCGQDLRDALKVAAESNGVELSSDSSILHHTAERVANSTSCTDVAAKAAVEPAKLIIGGKPVSVYEFLNEDEYAFISPRSVNFEATAKSLGLDPSKIGNCGQNLRDALKVATESNGVELSSDSSVLRHTAGRVVASTACKCG